MRPINVIAADVAEDIEQQLAARKRPNAHPPAWIVYANPYLKAMFSLRSIHDAFGADSGYSVVAYFLSNAGPWRGPNAKALRAELRAWLEEGERHPERDANPYG